jgi:hypothetical protein
MSEEQSVELVSASQQAEGVDAAEAQPLALSAVQERALQQLAAGTSIRETACVIGVHRRTVHRWLAGDANFAAAYNAWQRETIDSGRARVLAMTDLALDTVQTALQQGNARVALQVAKATGALDTPRPMASDPKTLLRRRELREGKRQLKLAAAEKQLKIDRGEDPKRDWMKDAEEVEGQIEWLLELRQEALKIETPKAREQRLNWHRYHRRSKPSGFLPLLELADAAVAAEASGKFPAIENGRNIPDGSVPYAAPLAACATGNPIKSGGDEPEAIDPATGALADPPPFPTPTTAAGRAAVAAAVPPTEPAALGGASVVTKALATRVAGSGQVQSVHKPYDPDAVDPLDEEHWVNL